MKRLLILIAGLLLAACGQAKNAEPARKRTSYDVDYLVEFQPQAKAAAVQIRIDPKDGRATRFDFDMDAKRYFDVRGDGEIQRKGDRLEWIPPKAGGTLSYRYLIDHQRRGGGYDARITPSWAIVRGDDLVPRAKVRTTKRADSRARLRFTLPKGWGVETPYVPAREKGSFVVVNPDRRFDRPVGWMLAGDIGARRDEIAGTNIAVAGPRGDDFRRVDTLAFITATLPEMEQAFDNLPSKLLIVGAGDPMWRGGLSGPRSLFLHADRPMISENGTSTLVHELIHVVTRIRGTEDDDWIAEGLAEFYAAELPRRAGLLSKSRYGKALDWMEDFGEDVKHLRRARSSGPVTARAAVLFAALDREIDERTDGKKDIDNVARLLMARREASIDDLREAAEKVIGAPAKTLESPLLD